MMMVVKTQAILVKLLVMPFGIVDILMVKKKLPLKLGGPSTMLRPTPIREDHARTTRKET